MATYDPPRYDPTAYNPAAYNPAIQAAAPPLGSRQNFNAGQYRLRAYPNAPPTQPQPDLLGPAQLPYPSPQMPAMSTRNSYGLNAAYPPVAARPIDPRLENAHPTMAEHILPRSSQDDYERRPSYSSQRSHHSHHSHRSHESPRRSHDSPRKSHDSPRKPHESHHSHHSHAAEGISARERRHSRHHDERDSEAERKRRKQLDAKLGKRPTYGDSLLAVWDVVKSALGPRDKY